MRPNTSEQPRGGNLPKRNQRHGYGREEPRTDTASEGTLAHTLQRLMDESRRSIYEVSNASGVDAAYIWRIVKGERQNVSREIIIRLGTALVLESSKAGQVIDTTNELLDAAGFKRLS